MNIYKDIQCPHFALCSGCKLNENVNQPALLEEVQKYFKDQGVSFDYYTDKMIEWRYRAKLVVSGSIENPLIGLYEEGTHHVVNIPNCRVHHPAINKAVKKLKEWIRHAKIPPYNEKTHEGLLRYIQCVVERDTGHVQLTLILNAPDEFKAPQWLEDLWVNTPDFWHSIWINLNPAQTNTIFGKKWMLIKGYSYLQETLTGVTLCFHPANFLQANLPVFEHLLQDLKNALKANQRVVEYYAGVGVIGRCLADKSKSVICNEINPWAMDAFLAAQQVKEFSNLQLITGPSIEHLSLMDQADVVIVDPPRKGLDKPLLDALLTSVTPHELWYISCGWTAFKRDCLALQKHWKLEDAKTYLFFPGTNQLEVLCRFTK